jgi:MoxR-like ATPase
VSLAAGLWGTPWRLEDVQKFLGLASLGQVERYTRLIEQAIQSRELEVAAADADAARPVRKTKWSTEPPFWNSDSVRLYREQLRAAVEPLVFDDDVLERTASALRSGKHVLFVGSPGTGKTELAHAVVAAATEAGYCRNAHVATACADWTSFDTIGGYTFGREGSLRFRSGALLRAIEQHQWLIIDEINRADVDRAFGELMTVLSNRTADTNFELDDGRVVRVGPLWDATHRVPPSFRVLATMNTWDKTSLFRLSYAVQRRFALVEVGVPKDEALGALIRAHAESAQDEPPLEPREVDAINMLFSSAGLLSARAVGPAIALDVVRYMRTRRATREIRGDAFAEALAMFVLPQLDGLQQEAARRAYTSVSGAAATLSSPAALAELEARFLELFPHVRLSSRGS